MKSINNILSIVIPILLVILLCLVSNVLIKPWYDYEKSMYPNQEAFTKTEEITKAIPWHTKVITAPIIEELIFRSPIYILLVYFAKHKKENKKLLYSFVIVLGILFGLMHITNGGAYVLPSIIFLTSLHGILFGALVVKTRQLYPAMMAHGGMNALLLAII